MEYPKIKMPLHINKAIEQAKNRLKTGETVAISEEDPLHLLSWSIYEEHLRYLRDIGYDPTIHELEIDYENKRIKIKQKEPIKIDYEDPNALTTVEIEQIDALIALLENFKHFSLTSDKKKVFNLINKLRSLI